MNSGEELDLQVPKHDLKTLSFSKADLPAIEEWLSGLPAANLGSMTRQLYEALNEINRFAASPQQRFDILEKFRPKVVFVNHGLERHFLKQPIILSDQARKVSDLAHALLSSLISGYISVALQCREKMRGFHFSKPTQLLAQSLDRALSDNARLLLLDYQLYHPCTKHFWERIHALYQLAEQHKVNHIAVVDPEVGNQFQSSPSLAYRRCLLLGCMKANQLRQSDIRLIAAPELLNDWASMTELPPAQKNVDHLFIVDPHTDLPPIYQKFYDGNYNGQCRRLDTSILVEYLRSKAKSPEDTGDNKLSNNLIKHLIVAWGVLTDRTFMRIEAHDQLALCIGLSTTHHFIGGALSFDKLVHGNHAGETPSSSLFLVDLEGEKHHDAWDDAFDSDKGGDVWSQAFKFKEEKNTKNQARISMESIEYHVRHDGTLGKDKLPNDSDCDKDKYQNYDVQMVNMSPGGYCLEWPDQAPVQLRTGEIIGIKETHHTHWSIGAIRWVGQDEDEHLQIGVELLSPAANPYGARILYKKGNSMGEFMRVLILPEIAPIRQPKTIITPAVSFKEGHKILLAQNGRETIVQLTRLVVSTGSYSQFEFQEAKHLNEQKREERLRKLSGSGDSFDSLWNNL